MRRPGHVVHGQAMRLASAESRITRVVVAGRAGSTIRFRDQAQAP